MTRPTVLIVDDDGDFLDIAGRAIRRARLEADVRFERSADGALRWLGLDAGGDAAPPLGLVAVFVDLSMPGLNGWDLLERIRADARTRDLPVVIVSSSSRAEDVRRSYDLGANSYVVKRFDPTGPGRYLTNAIRYWIELNRVPDWSPRLSW